MAETVKVVSICARHSMLHESKSLQVIFMSCGIPSINYSQFIILGHQGREETEGSSPEELNKRIE
jgi:hypothetical protein